MKLIRESVNEYRLVTLLEMLNFSAADWNEIIREVEALQNALNTKIASSWLENDRESLLLPLKTIREACQRLGLSFSASYADEIINMVMTKLTLQESVDSALSQMPRLSPKHTQVAKQDKDACFDPGSFLQEMKILKKRIDDELRGREFFALEHKWSSYFYEHHPFGEEIVLVLPAAIKDIEESSKCLALERSTACVFHLMRVMEIGLQGLGNKLNLQLLEDKNWQVILDQVNKAIKRLPSGTQEEKEVQGRYGETSNYLFSVKIAWRNDVMHPRGTYTQEDAAEIFAHVRTFTRYLVSKILV